MKKLLALVMCLTLVFSLTFVMSGCTEEAKKEEAKTSTTAKDEDTNKKETPAEKDHKALVTLVDDLKEIYDELTETVNSYNDGEVSSDDVSLALFDIADKLGKFPNAVGDYEWNTEEYKEHAELLNKALGSLGEFVVISVQGFANGEESQLEEANEYDEAYNKYMDELCEAIGY